MTNLTLSEVQQDLKSYQVALRVSSHTICADIERKYGAYGLPPNLATEVMVDIIEDIKAEG